MKWEDLSPEEQMIAVPAFTGSMDFDGVHMDYWDWEEAKQMLPPDVYQRLWDQSMAAQANREPEKSDAELPQEVIEQMVAEIKESMAAYRASVNNQTNPS